MQGLPQNPLAGFGRFCYTSPVYWFCRGLVLLVESGDGREHPAVGFDGPVNCRVSP